MATSQDEEKKRLFDQQVADAKRRRQDEWTNQQQSDQAMQAALQHQQMMQQQQMMNVVSSPDGTEPDPSKKGPIPQPDWVTKALKDYPCCKYDEKTGSVSFPRGPEGTSALADFLEKNPDAKFGTRGVKDMDEAKEAIRELRTAGIDVENRLGRMEIGGQIYEGENLKTLLRDELSPSKNRPS